MYNSAKAGYAFSEALLVDRKMRLRVWLKKMLINLSLLLFFFFLQTSAVNWAKIPSLLHAY